MKKGRAGQTVLAIYLILAGMQAAINLHFAGSGMLMGILALVAGILLLMGV